MKATDTAKKRVTVHCPDCGWKGRRLNQWWVWTRNREVATCPKCAHHPVKYQRIKD